MQNNKIKRPPHKKTKELRDLLDSNELLEHIMGKDHVDIHIEKNDTELMERILTDVTSNSTFENIAAADEYISEALYNQMDNIVYWVEDAKDKETRDFHVAFPADDEPIGRGFIRDHKTNTIKEYTTDTICIVLRRDFTNTKTGFHMVTAYPTLETPYVQTTNRDLRPIIRETEQYKTASPIKKAYMEYQTHPASKHLVTYNAGHYPSDDMLQLNIETKNPNIKHIIRIKENSCVLMTRDKQNENIPTTFTQLQHQLHPTHNGKPKLTVDLTDKQIWDTFEKSAKRSASIIKYLQKTINTHCNIKVSTTNDRIQKAEQLSETIEQPSDDNPNTSPDY